MPSEIREPPKGLRQRFVDALDRGIDRINRYASRDVSRALSDDSQAPEIAAGHMGRLILRAIPFLRPMLIHIIGFILAGFVIAAGFGFAAALGGDVWTNKILVNEKLQPLQQAFLFVDNTYLKTEFLSEEEQEEVEAAGFGGDELTQDQRKRVLAGFMVWSLIGAVCGVLLYGFYSYYGTWVWQNVNQFLRVSMIEKVEHLSLSFHHSNRSGDAIYRIYQDSSMIVNVLEECVLGPIEIVRDTLIAITFLMLLDYVMGLALLLAYVPMVVLTAYATPIIRRLAVANRVANSNLTSRIQETFTCLKVVKASGAENTMMGRFDRDASRALDAALYVRLGMVILSLIVSTLGALFVIGAEYILVKWTVMERPTNLPAWGVAVVSFTVWNLGAYNVANGRVGELIARGRGVVRLWCMLQDLFIGLERAYYFLDLKPNVTNPDNPKPFPATVDKVEWRDVYFDYEDGKSVLEGVSLTANQGTITAVVGSTGTGKSTLMSLLLRLYDPKSGTVRINDTDVREFSIEDMRANNAIALQKNVLFTGLVRENIAYAMGDNVPLETIQAAADVACASEFIAEMDRGFDTLLGERGGKLSSGQRQRLTIARAVIRNTSILILDEPTASLDAETEHRVLRNLSEWGREKVVFLITHRLSTIRNADQIAFLSGGKVVEVGAHDELMARPDGFYRAFVEAELVGEQGGVEST